MQVLFHFSSDYNFLLNLDRSVSRKEHDFYNKKYFCYMTEEQAQEDYAKGAPATYILNGFYSKKLSFSEWLEYYNVRIY